VQANTLDNIRRVLFVRFVSSIKNKVAQAFKIWRQHLFHEFKTNAMKRIYEAQILELELRAKHDREERTYLPLLLAAEDRMLSDRDRISSLEKVLGELEMRLEERASAARPRHVHNDPRTKVRLRGGGDRGENTPFPHPYSLGEPVLSCAVGEATTSSSGGSRFAEYRIACTLQQVCRRYFVLICVILNACSACTPP
jgi:hypothetical protein